MIGVCGVHVQMMPEQFDTMVSEFYQDYGYRSQFINDMVWIVGIHGAWLAVSSSDSVLSPRFLAV